MDRTSTHVRSKYVGVGGLRCFCCSLGGRRYAKRRSRRELRRRANASVRKDGGDVREWETKPMR
jgi:hypothetical protein